MHMCTMNACVAAIWRSGFATPTMANITFLDGTSVGVNADKTVTEVRRILTPPQKKYAHLDLYCEQPEDPLHGVCKLDPSIYRGIWERVERPPLSESCQDHPHLWEAVMVDGRATNIFQRIKTSDFHVPIIFEGNIIFSKMISRYLTRGDGYDPGIDLKLVVFQFDPPCPGPYCHRDWAQLYLDRVWVSRDIEFWADPRDCLFSCGVGPGCSLTAYMERLDLNHPDPEGDTEERRSRIRAKLKRKRELGGEAAESDKSNQ